MLLTTPTIQINKFFSCTKEIYEAITLKRSIVALETAVVSHGLPYPLNIELAESMETIIRQQGSVPATICVLDGQIRIGLSKNELIRIGNGGSIEKIGTRDLPVAISKNICGGTTVSATIFIADKIGIKVFATGGIGGVHRHNPYDISADLYQLTKTPLIVVCSGAKSILNLPATLEFLETICVPVIGYQTDEFPAFLTPKSGLKTQHFANSISEIIDIARNCWEIGLQNSIIVTVPPPGENALDADELEKVIEKAIVLADQNGITGQDITPYLLDQVRVFTDGASVNANIALLENNAKIASLIAKELAG